MSENLKPRASMLSRMSGTSASRLLLMRIRPCGVAIRYEARSSLPT